MQSAHTYGLKQFRLCMMSCTIWDASYALCNFLCAICFIQFVFAVCLLYQELFKFCFVQLFSAICFVKFISCIVVCTICFVTLVFWNLLWEICFFDLLCLICFLQFTLSNLFSTVKCTLQNLLCVLFFEQHCIAHIAFVKMILKLWNV